MLAEVIRKTLAGRDDVLFLVVGSGDLAAELESCAQEFGSRVMLTGPQRDVTPFYAVADVLFLPSRTEGLPLVLLEAFAHGVPVVASNVGGVPEVVEDGINGFLCDAKDTAQMHERLVQLLGDIALRRSFGVQARSTAEARFSLDRMILETCQVYRSLVPIGAA
jgi:glycosyltransferase involved in cell wall biosynthesis